MSRHCFKGALDVGCRLPFMVEFIHTIDGLDSHGQLFEVNILD